MIKKSLDDLGSLQKKIMEILWKLKEATVNQILDEFPPKKKPAYTTILTIVQRLEKMGWLVHRKEGKAYVYQAAQPREMEASRSIRRLIDRIFYGDSRLFIQHLIDEEELTETQLEELRKRIEEKKRQKRTKNERNS